MKDAVVYQKRYCYRIEAMNDATLLLQDARRRSGISQQELARRAGTSQSAIARLERGRSSPTLDTLQRLVEAAGFGLRLELVPRSVSDPVVHAYKQGVDRSLLRENLRKTVDERLRTLEEMNEFGDALAKATRARKRQR
jgi:transcriptional regulator with XRE-family HTH domain